MVVIEILPPSASVDSVVMLPLCMARSLVTMLTFPAVAVAVPVLHGPEISEPGTSPAAHGAQIASVVHAALPHEPGELTP